MPFSPMHNALLDSLGQKIVTGEYQPGDVMTLDAITRDFHVSMSVAREAVRVLECLFLVESRRRVGITVLPREEWTLLDARVVRWRLSGDERNEILHTLSDLRAGFEPVAAALATRRAKREHVAAMIDAVNEMKLFGPAQNMEGYFAAEAKFHRAILEACRNDMLVALGDLVVASLDYDPQDAPLPREVIGKSIFLHNEIILAIRDHDPLTAETAMREIVREFTAALDNTLAAG